MLRKIKTFPSHDQACLLVVEGFLVSGAPRSHGQVMQAKGGQGVLLQVEMEFAEV